MSNERQTELAQLLSPVSDAELRELCVAALRIWQQRAPGRRDFAAHGDLGQWLVPLLRQRAAVTLKASNHHEVFVEPIPDDEGGAAIQKVHEFLAWLVRRGLAIALSSLPNHFPIRYRLTPAGVAFLESAEGDHPLLPGAVKRVQDRCPGLGDDVVELLVDAHTCLDHGLLRPAIVAIGVAYEAAIEDVCEELIKRQQLDPGVLEKNASGRANALRPAIDQLPHDRAATAAQKERYWSTADAYNFADDLRRRRNDASHTRPRYGFTDGPEVEEFFVSAVRKLPALWSLAAPVP